MTLDNALTQMFISQGLRLPYNKLLEVRRQIREAIAGHRFSFVEKDNQIIGFFTWQEKERGIFINNMLVLKQFRNKDNFLYIRKMLRDKYPSAKCYYWKIGNTIGK